MLVCILRYLPQLCIYSECIFESTGESTASQNAEHFRQIFTEIVNTQVFVYKGRVSYTTTKASLGSRMMTKSNVAVYLLRQIGAFKGHIRIRTQLISLNNNPQQQQTSKSSLDNLQYCYLSELLAKVYSVQILCGGEKCILCARMLFLYSLYSHILIMHQTNYLTYQLTQKQ